MSDGFSDSDVPITAGQPASVPSVKRVSKTVPSSPFGECPKATLVPAPQDPSLLPIHQRLGNVLELLKKPSSSPQKPEEPQQDLALSTIS